MRSFQCPQCSSAVYFQNSCCLKCSTALVFCPRNLCFQDLQVTKLCRNGIEYGACSWSAAVDGELCLACARNETIPDLSIPSNLGKWRALEDAKKRLFFSCFTLGLPTSGLRFRFVARTQTEPAMTGHRDKVITVNTAEAEPLIREGNRLKFGEKLRTLLVHLRHEYAHYFWQMEIQPKPVKLQDFRALFGDEREDYQKALDQHYAAARGTGDEFISSYASSHPWEDWAETFAHYLHLRDTLETAQANGLSQCREFEFHSAMKEWIELSLKLNEMNRCLGTRDFYPFVLTEKVIDKLRFVHDTVSALLKVPAQ